MADLYLSSGNARPVFSGDRVFGASGTGTETVTITGGETGVTVDQNVEVVRLSNATGSYTFQQFGNQLAVFNNGTEVSRITLQNDNNGTLIAFANGTVEARVSATGLTLGGSTVSATAPGAVVPTSIDTSTGTGGSAFTLTAVAGEQINGTAGNDTINAIVGSGTGVNAPTINNFDSIQGGAGADTLNLIVDGAYALPGSATINGIETVNLSINAGATGTVNAAAFVGSTTIRQAGTTALGLTGLTNQNVVFTDAVANVAYANAATAANITLDGVDSGSVLNIDGINLTALTLSGSVEAAGAAAGSLVVTTTSEDTSTTANDGSNIANITASFTSAVDLDITDFADTLVTFDASTSTGALTVDFDDMEVLQTANLTALADTARVDFDALDAATVAINLGAGNDSLTVYDVLSSSSAEDAAELTITLGAGRDQVTFDDLQNLDVDSADQELNGLISIADFNGSQDFLNLTVGGTAHTVTTVEQGEIENAETLFEAIEYVAGQFTGTEQHAAFVYGGNTYVYNDADTDGTLSSSDGLLQLTGFTGALNETNFVIA